MYSLSSRKVDYGYWGQDSGPLQHTITYSVESNELTVVGVNTLAYITDEA